MRFEPIDANGKRYEVKVVATDLKRMYARVVDGKLVIQMPASWDRNYAMESAIKLYERARRFLMRHPERFDRKRMEVRDGMEIRVLGRAFRVSVTENPNSSSSRARLDGDTVAISLSGRLSQKDRARHAESLLSRTCSKAVLPALADRVNRTNAEHFRSTLGAIRIRNNTSKWGSCTSRNNLSFSFRLLLLPDDIIDYVIAHELAHTKVRSHSQRFWAILGSIVPDYKQKRKWLNAH